MTYTDNRIVNITNKITAERAKLDKRALIFSWPSLKRAQN